MRIAVFGGYSSSLVRFRGAMLQAMVGAGHEVVAMAPEQDAALAPGEDPGLVRSQLAAMGVAFRPVPLGRTGLNPLADLRSLGALASMFRELRPDLLLSYTIKPVIYGSLAAAWAGVPHRFAMITGVGSVLEGRGPKLGVLAAVAKRLYRLGLARNEGVFFQNPDNRAFFERHRLLAPGCRVTMINGSGVDLAQFPRSPVPGGPASFLMVARVARDKGVLEFAEAARLLKARHPEARCRLVGPIDSNLTALPRQVVAQWQREGILDYPGPARDVRPELAACQVFVLPSYGEGTPRSVLEAMAAGRAVVTTRVPGCKETVLEGRTGFLVPPRDPEALAEAMARFVADPSLAIRMGEQGYQYAAAKYDVHKVNRVILGALGLHAQDAGLPGFGLAP
ncbi:MAG: glycosyltransferase family 4 protein [Holophaga sp.]|nr:glycosyltransferase family 4 protein [Holophaga sp.]